MWKDQLSQSPHILSITILCFSTVVRSDDGYYGTYLGSFNNLAHNVKGDVYAVDRRSIYIKDFTYDGQGPDAYFYAGYSGSPSSQGFRIPNEKGLKEILKSYNSQDILLTIPSDKKLKKIRWISVWCHRFTVSFGDIQLPDRVQIPTPRKLGQLNGDHGVSSGSVVIVDAQTLLIPSFSYDGEAPDAHFWVGTTDRPGADGTPLADENGSMEPLKRYNNKTLVIVLPDSLTVFDINWLSVWCIAFFVDFAHIKIPDKMNIPPSLSMLGIEPQTKLNCEVLDEGSGFETRWAIAGRNIVIQLVARLGEGEYMAFGLSGDEDGTQMVGGDVTVAYMDHSTGQGFAEDYFLGDKSQCSGGRGSCPDSTMKDGKNDVQLLNSALINQFTMLTYRRPLKSKNEASDRDILVDQEQALIWAIGPINSRNEVSYHSKRNQNELRIQLGRNPQWNCPIAGKDEEKERNSASEDVSPRRIDKERPTPRPLQRVKDPWYIPPIDCSEPEDGYFFAQIGPTGGDRGYSSITGHVGWGISWYVNGLLIPEITLIRGKNYTFVVEGGDNPDRSSSYHPFYITDDPEGGYAFKSESERRNVRVFAGVERSTNGRDVQPTGTGRLCEWKLEEETRKKDMQFASFGAFQRKLNLECEEGNRGFIQWRPDENTPDLVYYQCFTHRYLGWKIHIVDDCKA